MSNPLVILPTYNEAENLEPLVEQIFLRLPQILVLVVDDGSPDGTGEIADKLAEKYPGRVQVLKRTKKEGLGKAYLEAFEFVLTLNVDQIVQMDADFSHPPSLLPKLLEALKEYDFVLGSRYTSGGSIENWNLSRRLLSKMGNIYAKTILHLPVRDLTGGFKAFNRSVLEFLVHYPITSHGYYFQIETTARAIAAGFSFTEIPFTFTERRKGVSKMSKGIVWEALIKTFQLRKIVKIINRSSRSQNLRLESRT